VISARGVRAYAEVAERTAVNVSAYPTVIELIASKYIKEIKPWENFF
jgi:hypothetical protein